MKNKPRLFAIIALIVAGVALAAITVGGIGQNLVYYWGPTDLRNAGNKAYGATIRLGGQVKAGSIRPHANELGLDFEVTDGKNSVPVRSTAVPPQMFREGIGVVVEGTMTRGGQFESDRLMVSHNNEYRAPGEGEVVDAKKLMQSTDGVDPQKVKGAS